MTAKIGASADNTKVTIGNAAEMALEIDSVAKTIKALAPYQMAGNGPAFAASGLLQQFTVNAPTKVSVTTEIFDTNNCYDAPNSRFTPNVPGYYQCNISLNNQVAIDTFGMYGWIAKNGNVVAQGGSTGNAAAFAFATASCVVYMNGTTDFIEGGATLTGPTGTGNGLCNNFSAALVRAA
jgi:hypothetical protein